MAAPGSPDPQTITITSPGDSTGKTYELAIERGGRIAHTVTSRGEDLRHEHDFRSGSLGMGETVQQTPTGYLFADNMDLTKRGARLSPTITTVSVTALSVSARPPVFFEEIDSGSTRYVYVYGNISGTQVRAYKIRASDDSQPTNPSKTDPAIAAAGAGPGRPERFEGKWYSCASFGSDARVDSIEQLTTCGVSDATNTNDTWTAIDTAGGVDVLLRIDPASGTSRMARSTNTNKI